MGEPFVHPVRVRYAECDMLGIVFNAHYLAYFDIAMTELWRAAFGGYQAMTDRGIELAVARTELQFRAPARFDDELSLQVGVARLGNTSVTTRHRIVRAETVIVDGEMSHVFVERGSLRKLAIPDWARQGLAPWEL